MIAHTQRLRPLSLPLQRVVAPLDRTSCALAFLNTESPLMHLNVRKTDTMMSVQSSSGYETARIAMSSRMMTLIFKEDEIELIFSHESLESPFD